MRIFYSIMTLFLILLSPLAAAYSLSEASVETFTNSSNTPEWYDGHFNGQFYRLFPASNGTISGTITLGKSSFRGTFSANWMLENTTGIAIVMGIVGLLLIATSKFRLLK